MKNFALVILDFPTKENLHIFEQKFMDELKPEYNVLSTAGVRTGKKIKRISMSEEQKKKLAKKKGADHHRFGIQRTSEELILMRDNHPKTKKVYQYLANGTFVAE